MALGEAKSHQAKLKKHEKVTVYNCLGNGEAQKAIQIEKVIEATKVILTDQ